MADDETYEPTIPEQISSRITSAQRDNLVNAERSK